MSADVLTATFVGLGTVLTAISGIAAQRARSAGITRRQYRRLERKFLAALAHIFAVEQDYTSATGKPPRPRPAELNDDDDDDVGPAPAAIPRG